MTTAVRSARRSAPPRPSGRGANEKLVARDSDEYSFDASASLAETQVTEDFATPEQHKGKSIRCYECGEDEMFMEEVLNRYSVVDFVGLACQKCGNVIGTAADGVAGCSPGGTFGEMAANTIKATANGLVYLVNSGADAAISMCGPTTVRDFDESTKYSNESAYHSLDSKGSKKLKRRRSKKSPRKQKKDVRDDDIDNIEDVEDAAVPKDEGEREDPALDRTAPPAPPAEEEEETEVAAPEPVEEVKTEPKAAPAEDEIAPVVDDEPAQPAEETEEEDADNEPTQLSTKGSGSVRSAKAPSVSAPSPTPDAVPVAVTTPVAAPEPEPEKTQEEEKPAETAPKGKKSKKWMNRIKSIKKSKSDKKEIEEMRLQTIEGTVEKEIEARPKETINSIEKKEAEVMPEEVVPKRSESPTSVEGKPSLETLETIDTFQRAYDGLDGSSKLSSKKGASSVKQSSVKQNDSFGSSTLPSRASMGDDTLPSKMSMGSMKETEAVSTLDDLIQGTLEVKTSVGGGSDYFVQTKEVEESPEVSNDIQATASAGSNGEASAAASIGSAGKVSSIASKQGLEATKESESVTDKQPEEAQSTPMETENEAATTPEPKLPLEPIATAHDELDTENIVSQVPESPMKKRSLRAKKMVKSLFGRRKKKRGKKSADDASSMMSGSYVDELSDVESDIDVLEEKPVVPVAPPIVETIEEKKSSESIQDKCDEKLSEPTVEEIANTQGSESIQDRADEEPSEPTGEETADEKESKSLVGGGVDKKKSPASSRQGSPTEELIFNDIVEITDETCEEVLQENTGGIEANAEALQSAIDGIVEGSASAVGDKLAASDGSVSSKKMDEVLQSNSNVSKDFSEKKLSECQEKSEDIPLVADNSVEPQRSATPVSAAGNTQDEHVVLEDVAVDAAEPTLVENEEDLVETDAVASADTAPPADTANKSEKKMRGQKWLKSLIKHSKGKNEAKLESEPQIEEPVKASDESPAEPEENNASRAPTPVPEVNAEPPADEKEEVVNEENAVDVADADVPADTASANAATKKRGQNWLKSMIKHNKNKSEAKLDPEPQVENELKIDETSVDPLDEKVVTHAPDTVTTLQNTSSEATPVLLSDNLQEHEASVDAEQADQQNEDEVAAAGDDAPKKDAQNKIRAQKWLKSIIGMNKGQSSAGTESQPEAEGINASGIVVPVAEDNATSGAPAEANPSRSATPVSASGLLPPTSRSNTPVSAAAQASSRSASPVSATGLPPRSSTPVSVTEQTPSRSATPMSAMGLPPRSSTPVSRGPSRSATPVSVTGSRNGAVEENLVEESLALRSKGSSASLSSRASLKGVAQDPTALQSKGSSASLSSRRSLKGAAHEPPTLQSKGSSASLASKASLKEAAQEPTTLQSKGSSTSLSSRRSVKGAAQEPSLQSKGSSASLSSRASLKGAAQDHTLQSKGSSASLSSRRSLKETAQEPTTLQSKGSSASLSSKTSNRGTAQEPATLRSKGSSASLSSKTSNKAEPSGAGMGDSNATDEEQVASENQSSDVPVEEEKASSASALMFLGDEDRVGSSTDLTSFAAKKISSLFGFAADEVAPDQASVSSKASSYSNKDQTSVVAQTVSSLVGSAADEAVPDQASVSSRASRKSNEAQPTLSEQSQANEVVDEHLESASTSSKKESTTNEKQANEGETLNNDQSTFAQQPHAEPDTLQNSDDPVDEAPTELQSTGGIDSVTNPGDAAEPSNQNDFEEEILAEESVMESEAEYTDQSDVESSMSVNESKKRKKKKWPRIPKMKSGSRSFNRGSKEKTGNDASNSTPDKRRRRIRRIGLKRSTKE